MNTENYERVTRVIEKGDIGDSKFIRVYKNSSVKDVDLADAIRFELYEDIKFIISRLGQIERMYAKTVDLKNTIIMFRHVNKTISHVALNLFTEPVLQTFRVEVAGDKGLIDYDSDKSIPVFFNNKLSVGQKDYACERRLFEDNCDTEAVNVITEIMSKLIGGDAK